MLNFPRLHEEQYIKTRRRIHSIAKLLGRLREVLVEPIAKNDNLWLNIVDKGFCTTPMAAYNELEIGCNLEILCVEIANNKERYVSISFLNKTLRTLAEEIVIALKNEFGVSPELNADEFDNERLIELDAKDAQDFLGQLVLFSASLKEFHSTIGFSDGIKTQISLWPHHFDNAFKWFSGRKIDDGDELMGIGVSNGDDMYEMPYVYMTLWPQLRKTNTLDIPDGAVLHDGEWQGFILPYDSIIDKHTAEEQNSLIKNFYSSGFAAIKRGFSKR